MFIMRKYEMLGFFIIAFFSIILALLFFILPSNTFLDGIKPTSDSLWQVSKLMFISTLTYIIIEYFIFGHEFHNFVFAKAATLFIAPLLFIILSYAMDIGMGFVSFNNHVVAYTLALAAGQYVSFYILKDGYYFKLMNGYAIVGIVLMLAMFIGFGRATDKFDAPIFKSMDHYQKYFTQY